MTSPQLPRFHLAIPVDDLDAAAAFYGATLGCPRGRSAETWIDWDLCGHQLVTHLVAERRPEAHDPVPVHDPAPAAHLAPAPHTAPTPDPVPAHDAAPANSPVRAHNPVDGHEVPVPHFGLLLSIPAFHEMAERLRAAGTDFEIAPYLRFEGQVGEQWTMFFHDPAGNAIEIKAFADDSQVFAV